MKFAHQELLDFAQSLADAARPISRRWFRSELAIHIKADGSPVTAADLEVEAHLRGLIRARYPRHGIFGEEGGVVPARSDLTWVLDPIDGTKSFATGMPIFGTLIALLHQGRPCIGVVDMPALDERWVAGGGATTFNGRPCRTRGDRLLARAMAYTSAHDCADEATRASLDRVGRAAAIRCVGGDCYPYALLASGAIDVVVEAGLEPCDHLPLVPVVEGAGGVLTDWSGRPLGTSSDGRVVAAASMALHAEVLGALRDRRGGTAR